MDRFYKTTMKLKNHKKLLSILSTLSQPNETTKLLLGNNIAVGATSLLYSITPDNPIEYCSYIPLGIFFAYASRKVSDNSLIYTDDYFNTLEEYKKYISDLAMIFKELKINDPITISYIFSNLFISGLLSCDPIEKDINIKHPKKETYPELLGTKATTGSLSSRYASSMLSDLLNELGHNTCVLSLEPKYEENTFHTVVGIIDNKRKYAYDPINADIIYTNRLATTFISNSILEDGKALEYTILSDESYALNKSRIKNFIEYSFCKAETEDLVQPKREMAGAIASLAVTTEMSNFYDKHEKSMQKIKKLSEKLYPSRN